MIGLFRKYKKNLKLKDYEIIGEYGRTEAYFVTDRLEIVVEYTAKGWKSWSLSNGFLLRAPDTWLVDLSSPLKVFLKGERDPIINFAYYLYLKNFSNLESYIERSFNLKNGIILSKGPSLESEIRIICSHKDELNLIQKKMFSSFLESNECKNYIKKAERFLGFIKNKCKIDYNKPIEAYPPRIKKLFKEISQNYSIINSSKRDLVRGDFIQGIVEQVDCYFPNIDVIVFVPYGCFKFLNSFLSKKNIDKIMFWEFHLHPFEQHNCKFKSKSFKGKEVLIIDQVYSGRTICALRNLVQAEGGKPITLGVFPKSSWAIKRCDFILFLNKIIPSYKIINLKVEEIYREVLKNNL